MIISKTNGTDSLWMSDIKSITFKTYTTIPTDSLIAWYSFNGNANDYSGKGNNGTNNGATLTTDRFGNSNSAYSFNGTSNYINVPSLNNIQYFPVTYSVWVKTVGLVTNLFMGSPGWGGFNAIIGRDASGNTTEGLLALSKLIPPSTLTLDNKIWYYTGATSANYDYTPPLNTWIHIVYTSDGSQSKLYVNGALYQTIAFTATQNANINFNIGSGGGRGFWNGLIDDIRIYKRTLSDLEIQSLYHEGGW